MPTLASKASASATHWARGRLSIWIGAATTFSRTVMYDHRLKLWNTIAAARRRRSTCRRSAEAARPLRSFSKLSVSRPTRIVPWSGVSRRLMQRSMVDLPETDDPRIDTTSPSQAVSDTPFRTSSAPKLLCRSTTLTAARARQAAESSAAFDGASLNAALLRSRPRPRCSASASAARANARGPPGTGRRGSSWKDRSHRRRRTLPPPGRFAR